MAVISQGVAVVNFEVYVSGSDRLIGLANVELPTVSMETVDMKGSGLAGTIAMPVRSNTESMELKLVWRRMEKDAAGLIAHKSIDLSLYSVQSGMDAATGEMHLPQHKIETRVVPKTLNLGKWEPSATTDGENTFEVITLNYAIDGKSVLKFDKMNYIFEAGGEDFGSAIRKGLGL